MRILLAVLVSCQLGAVEFIPAADEAAFNRQWYEQGGEITTYQLDQGRYGGQHPGTAVWIFVTEPFDPQAQVKADRPAPGNVPVLKLNATRSFTTGVYPYNVMQSVFMPIDHAADPLPLKYTTSITEWCGQVFMQANRGADDWRVRSFSYFQSEGDRDHRVARMIPEEALYLTARLAPQDLPQGSFQMLPSTVVTRFRHVPYAPVTATASFGAIEDGAVWYEWQTPLHHAAMKIELAFPHRIEAWREDQGGTRTTAVATHRRMLAYWQFNRPQDGSLRESLGLGNE